MPDVLLPYDRSHTDSVHGLMSGLRSCLGGISARIHLQSLLLTPFMKCITIPCRLSPSGRFHWAIAVDVTIYFSWRLSVLR